MFFHLCRGPACSVISFFQGNLVLEQSGRGKQRRVVVLLAVRLLTAATRCLDDCSQLRPKLGRASLERRQADGGQLL
jgi:hypothetical protein